MGRNFFDLYAHKFARIAAAVPHVHLAQPHKNAEHIAELYSDACSKGAAVVVFPELSLAGYTLDDIHQLETLLRGVMEGIHFLREVTASEPALLLVGAPIVINHALYNCAVAMSGGKILGIVPKTYLPNYREFYEKRQFASADKLLVKTISFLDQHDVPVGSDLIFTCQNLPDLAVHAEICEDSWAPLPPSTSAAMAGATVLANLSASNITVAKSEFRRNLVQMHAAKNIAAMVYVAAGPGESSTDLSWDGHGLICEQSTTLAESERFVIEGSQMVYGDVDLERLVNERLRTNTFIDCAAATKPSCRRVSFQFKPRTDRVYLLSRTIERFPYVPSDPTRRSETCYEVYNIQVAGLLQRMRASGFKKLVIGVSGGLDSTHALIVAARCMDRLGLPRRNILAYTMPAYATSDLTKSSAIALMKALDVTWEVLDIVPSCEQMLKDLRHPYATEGKRQFDVTFENVQAGERTNHLFRLANLHSALVLGTGDLSELALGWCTYGVGDHMSHYNVNASVPKTLIQFVIRWVADHDIVGQTASPVLRAILDTEISPELVPGDDFVMPKTIKKAAEAKKEEEDEKKKGSTAAAAAAAAAKKPAQSTEATVGPYNLHDFFLFYTVRRGYSPIKVLYMALHTWGAAAGSVVTTPAPAAASGSRSAPTAAASGPSSISYDAETVLHWLRAFLDRFFRTSQFKRSCVPNGPKVGDGASLSPRGDWRAPSDTSSALWLRDWEQAKALLAESRRAGAGGAGQEWVKLGTNVQLHKQ